MIRVYDNGGATIDRFTVIIGKDVYGMSDNANMPNGFCQYIGTVQELGGISTISKLDGERHIGLDSLPIGVQIQIKRLSV